MEEIEQKRKAIQRSLSMTEQAGTTIGFFFCPVCQREHPAVSGHLHEWLFKRGDNVPDDITFSQKNSVILCGDCHKNTKEVDEACRRFKSDFFNPYGWVKSLLKSGQIKHWPERLPRGETTNL
jgi:hypothetical protein